MYYLYLTQNYIHLSVAGGGCAGFSYKWNFANEYDNTDEVINIEQDLGLVDYLDGYGEAQQVNQVLANLLNH